MIKKWLYSVAVGALLMACEALGITVHDVLSNGFWSAEQRASKDYLNKITGWQYTSRQKNGKYKETEQGVIFKLQEITSGPKIDQVRWKHTKWFNALNNGIETVGNFKEKLVSNRPEHKEKLLTHMEEVSIYWIPKQASWLISDDMKISETYTAKPRKKDVRPMGPLVVNDWFPNSIEKSRGVRAQFYGTEENAVTNIVSDNEAYITRTIAQTGYIGGYYQFPLNEDASLSRTYNTHITTDEDHVYVDQTICENTINNPDYNQQDAYQTQYIATFKKGQWKNSTETITHTSNQQMADWYFNYLTQDQEQTTRISSHQSDYLSQRLKDTQNFR